MAITERNIDQGYAWVVLASAFCVQMIAAMLVYSPGVLNIVILQEVDNDLMKTSWIGSTLYGTFSFLGPVAGLVYKKLGPRLTTVIGGVTVLLGMTTASFCRSIEGLILTYGLITGLGMCFGGNVVGVVPGEYFIKRRSLAYGVTMSGGAMGLFVVGPLLRYLLLHYGLSGTLLLYGGVAFHMCVAGMLFWKQGPVLKQQQDKIQACSTSDDVLYLDESKDVDGCVHANNLQKHKKFRNGDDIQLGYLHDVEENEFLPSKTLETNMETDTDYCLTDIDEAKDVKCVHLNIDHPNLHRGERTNGSSCDIHEQELQHSDLSSEEGQEEACRKINIIKTSHANHHSLTDTTKCDAKALRIVPNLSAFLFYNIGIIFWSLGESACMFHLPNYVQSKGSSFSQAAFMFTAVGAGGIFSKIVTGLMASDSNIGHTTLHVGLSGVSGTIVLLFPLYSDTYPLQLTFCVLYGMYNQGVSALLSSITISLIGLPNVALGFGVVYFSCGVGFFVGPPIASAIFKQSGSYDNTYFFSGACLIISSLSTAVAHTFARPIRET